MKVHRFRFKTDFLDFSGFAAKPSRSIRKKSPPPPIISHHLPLTPLGYLPYNNFPSTLPSPFQVYVESSPSTQIAPRISVTKMITNLWCELRLYFDVYLKYQYETTWPMQIGKEYHAKLEDEAHPEVPAPEADEFFQSPESVQLVVSSEPHIVLADEWAKMISKFSDLFYNGSAREVRVHGFIDSKTNELVSKNNYNPLKKKQYTLISGIIDHLELNDSASFEPFGSSSPWRDMRETISSPDIGDIIHAVGQFQTHIPLLIKDVKTRAYPSLPKQPNVIHGNRMQLFIYRKLLGLLSGEPHLYEQPSKDADAHFTYQMMIDNALARKMNVDAPISPEQYVYLLLKFPALLGDAHKLRDGLPIGFPPFDSQKSSSSSCWMIPKETFTQEAMDTVLDDPQFQCLFSVNFAKPPTLKYLCARLSQCYSLLGKFLSNQCSLQYYTASGRNWRPLYEAKYEYSEYEVLKYLNDANDFWVGRRGPHPIAKTEKDVYCKSCRYKKNCLWFNEDP